MSYKATGWAYDLPLKGAPKPVLVALADMADEAASCYPGQERLSAMTGLSVKTVSRALARLEAAGLIKRERRFDAFGHRTSDRYHLQLTVTLPESLTDNLPTRQSGHKAESPSQPDSLSSPTGHSGGVTTRRTTRENHQTDITPVSLVTNVPQGASEPRTDQWDEAALEVGITDLDDVRRELMAATGMQVSRFDALVFAQELATFSQEPVTNLGGYVFQACRKTPLQVRDYYNRFLESKLEVGA